MTPETLIMCVAAGNMSGMLVQATLFIVKPTAHNSPTSLHTTQTIHSQIDMRDRYDLCAAKYRTEKIHRPFIRPTNYRLVSGL